MSVPVWTPDDNTKPTQHRFGWGKPQRTSTTASEAPVVKHPKKQMVRQVASELFTSRQNQSSQSSSLIISKQPFEPAPTATQTQTIHKSSSKSAIPSSSKNENNQAFWTTKGMDAFIDWVTDPDNYLRLNNPRPTAGKKAVNIHLEIAKYVNGIHETDWTGDTVESKLQYMKKKYSEARTILSSTRAGDTDETTLHDQVIAICPEYDRIHAVYGGSLLKNPPRPRQSVVYQEDEPTVDHGMTEEGEHLIADDDGSVISINDRGIERPSTEDTESIVSMSNRKRQKTSKKPQPKVPGKLEDSMSAIARAANSEAEVRVALVQSSVNDLDEVRKVIQHREAAIDEREKESHRRLIENEMKHQAMLDRRYQELMVEKDEFKKSIQKREDELKKREEALAQKAEALEKKAESLLELKIQNALLKQELNQRTVQNQNNGPVQL
ncbi:hypothetical protein BGZ76_005400 [Entomortierella beljakovae]|nr:hypothetical protein BGZ76_005400 [Entomortierella beljakovae]